MDESGTPFSVESPWSEPPTPSPRFNVPATHHNDYPQQQPHHQPPHPLSQHQLLRQHQMMRRGGGLAADIDHLAGGYWPRSAGIIFVYSHKSGFSYRFSPAVYKIFVDVHK